VVAGDLDVARRHVRLEDVPFARVLDLGAEPLPPGIPDLVLQPPRWDRVLWVAASGAGRSLAGRWLAARGREVLLTDGSPSMVRIAREKLRSQRGPQPRVVAAEGVGALADEHRMAGIPPFDGAFSNFAALNCVDTLDGFAAGLARLLRPGAPALLVLFGTLCPGELVVQIVLGDVRAALRRRARGPVAARLGGRDFTVRDHTASDVQRAASDGAGQRLRALGAVEGVS
jgi:SAM-dependent methyltransferase